MSQIKWRDTSFKKDIVEQGRRYVITNDLANQIS